MMNYFLSVVLTFALAFSILEVSAQTFDYFSNNPEWRVTESYGFNDSEFDPAYTAHSHFVYYINGDSLINDTTYLKVFKRGETTSDGVTGSPFDFFNCFVRQEDKKVFKRIDNEEFLLFDFDLELGDEFPDVLYFTNQSNEPYIVQYVDTMVINGNIHRVFYGIDGFNPLIEGVGHYLGVFNESFLVEVNGVTQLVCYRQQQTTYYPENDTDGCNFEVGIVGIDEFKNEIQIKTYPNPATNNLFIELPISLSSSNAPTLTLRNAQGKLMMSRVISSSETALSLDISSCSQGIYLLSILADGKALLNDKIILE